MDTIDGMLSRILYHSPSKFSKSAKSGSMFLIAKLHNGTLIKGEMSKPVESENYRLWGEWCDQKPPYNGRAFEFIAFEPVVDRSEVGITQYLKTYVDGLGPVRAHALVAAFGLETLDVLRLDPARAAEVKGITPKLAGSIRDHFLNDLSIDPTAYARLVDLFAGFVIPRRVILKLLEWWKSSAPDIVLRTPYELLAIPRLGWETVDSFARTVAAYPADGMDRHVAALVEGLTRIALDGHTVASRVDLEVMVFPLLGGLPRADAWDEAIARQEVRHDAGNGWFGLPKLWDAEQRIADRLRVIGAAARPLDFELDTKKLQGEQVDAARLIQASGICILAGAPGTGKSTTTAVAVRSLLDHGITRIHVGCPTGKAAKRSGELLDDYGIEGGQVPSTTLHRMLVPVPSEAPEGVPAADAKFGRGREEFAFSKGRNDPLDVDVLIADECSMVDVSLMAATLDAVPPGARVLFVGDPNQLPSVGPGAVLRDLMASVPTARLTEIRRSQPGRIIHACHDILKGRCPQPAVRIDLENGENWVHIEIDDPHAIAAQIVDLHRPMKRFPDPVWDLQVVVPQKTRLPMACDHLNRLLSARLNPAPQAGAAADGDEKAPDFRVGDKVIRVKNGLADRMVRPTPPPTADHGDPPFDWATGAFVSESEAYQGHVAWTWDHKDWGFVPTTLVNGDMGTVLDIVIERRNVWVVVRFRDPDRLCRLAYATAELQPAYAITCHKAQGSGFPMVIVPVHNAWYWDPRTETGIWCREWFYTAASRAEQLLVTVGPFSAITKAVGRRTVHKRRTRLAQLVAIGDNSRLRPVEFSAPAPALPATTTV